jgi:hypothetical protein
LRGGEYLLQQDSKLNFPKSPAALDVRQDALKIADALRESLHLAKSSRHAVKLLGDCSELFAEPRLESLLQLFVNGDADLFQRLLVVLTHGIEALTGVRLKLVQRFRQFTPQVIESFCQCLPETLGSLCLLLRDGRRQIAQGSLLGFHPSDESLSKLALRRFDALKAIVLGFASLSLALGQCTLKCIEALILFLSGRLRRFGDSPEYLAKPGAELVFQSFPQGSDLLQTLGGLLALPLLKPGPKSLVVLAGLPLGFLDFLRQEPPIPAEQEHEEADQLEDEDRDKKSQKDWIWHWRNSAPHGEGIENHDQPCPPGEGQTAGCRILGSQAS